MQQKFLNGCFPVLRDRIKFQKSYCLKKDFAIFA